MSTSIRAAVLAALWVGAAAAADPPSKGEIARAGKAGCALADGKTNSGSAFCVSAGGYFVTNEHVVSAAGVGGTIKLVLNAGEKEQQVVEAKVVRADKKLDLALLKADLKAGPAPLPLGDDAKLGELDEVIGFGFPFGKDISKTDDYPTISVSAGTVSSLRRSKERELERVQIDGAFNPGNSGGPILDRKGEVVGVIVSGIRGSGLNQAIPVSHVKKFLEKPEITLTAPEVDPKAKYDKATYKASVLTVPESADPVGLELVITSDGRERRFEMPKAGAGYEVAAAAFDRPSAVKTVAVEVAFADGTVKAPVGDAKFSVGGKEYTLSGVSKVRFGKPAAVVVGEATAEGELVGLERVTLEVGGQAVPLSVGSARELVVVPPPAAKHSYLLSVVANRKGKEVGRTEVVKYLVGMEPGGVEALLKGKFVKPPEALKPTTYGKVVSTSGDYIGQGKKYTFAADQLVPRNGFGGVSVECKLAPVKVSSDFSHTPSFTLTISAPKGETLEAKEYPKAMRAAFAEKGLAGLDFSGDGRGSNTLSGRFVVWEIEMDNTTLKSLAVDFIQHSEGKTDTPLVGSIRINSKFE